MAKFSWEKVTENFWQCELPDRSKLFIEKRSPNPSQIFRPHYALSHRAPNGGTYQVDRFKNIAECKRYAAIRFA